jgi:hypothetical protein
MGGQMKEYAAKARFLPEGNLKGPRWIGISKWIHTQFSYPFSKV